MGAALTKLPDSAATPATASQISLWLQEQIPSLSGGNNLASLHTLSPTTDLARLESCFQQLLLRHEVLRTRFDYRDSRLIQIVEPNPDWRASLEIASDARPGNGSVKRILDVNSWAKTLVGRAFDLSKGPLLRVAFLTTDPETTYMLICAHHTVFDAWSFEILSGELRSLYAGSGAPDHRALPPLPLRFSDYAQWQTHRLGTAFCSPLLDYWKRLLAPAIGDMYWVSDQVRPLAAIGAAGYHQRQFQHKSASGIIAFERQYGYGLFATFIAVFCGLWYRYTGQIDQLIGTPVSTRHHAGLQSMVGMLVNTLPLRIGVKPKGSWHALIQTISDVIAGALAHQELPITKIVEAVNPPRDPGRSPLVPVMFSYRNVPRADLETASLFSTSEFIAPPVCPHDLLMTVELDNEAISVHLQYRKKVMSDAAAGQFLAHFEQFAAAAASAAEMPISTLNYLAEPEVLWLLDQAKSSPRNLEPDHWTPPGPGETNEGPAQTSPIPAAAETVILKFRQQVMRRPDACALRYHSLELTYAQIDAAAEQWAEQLVRMKVRPGDIVGIQLPRTPALIQAMLAVLKVGAAYCPFDIDTPKPYAVRRLRRIGAQIIISDAAPENREEIEGLYWLDAGSSLEPQSPGAPPCSGGNTPSRSLACILFTSGTTEQPLAVEVSDPGLLRLVCQPNYLDIGEDDHFLHHSTPSFDAASFEIWGALLNGACVVLNKTARFDPRQIATSIQDNRVSVLWMSSAAFGVFADIRAAALPTLRALLVGGDVVSPVHAHNFLTRNPQCRLVNCYGPTENTTFSTFHRVRLDELVGIHPIALGRPISGTRVYLLDAARNLVPPGVIGEAYLGGDGLALGYRGNEAMNRERFVQLQLPGVSAQPVFRSGDLMRRRPDGILEFLGRVAADPKVRGFRVSLAELENELLADPAIGQACVILEDRQAGQIFMRAMVTARSDRQAIARRPNEPGFFTQQLRARLAERLPSYLLPDQIVLMDAIPTTPEGKVDRKSVREQLNSNSQAVASARTGHVAAPLSIGTLDDLETELVQLLITLGLAQATDADQSYFELGGNSLLAVHLLLAIEKRFGCSLTIDDLYRRPSIRGIAASLRLSQSNRIGDPVSHRKLGTHLVSISPGCSRRPLFIVPGGHGGIADLLLAAQAFSRLRSQYDLFGFVAKGLDGKSPIHRGVDAMARDYVDELLLHHSGGQIVLLGECIGGVIAYEMGRRLIELGHSDTHLILLDSWCPNLRGQLRFEYLTYPSILLNDFRKLRARRTPLRIALRTPGAPSPGQTRFAERRFLHVLMSHRPLPSRQRVTLLATAASLRLKLDLDWRKLALSGLELHPVPGVHESFLRDEAAALSTLLAHILRRWFGGVEPNSKINPQHNP